ncbi:MAG: hypothetical protein ACREDR_09300 [Blastocatellia bacterium]
MFASRYSLLLLVLISAPVSAATRTDRQRGDLKGAVKSVRTVSAMYSGPAGQCSQEKQTLESISRYNADGNLALFTDYNYDGSIHRKDVFTYGASGARQSQVSYDKAGFAFSKQTFDPNNAGLPATSDMYKADGSIDRTTTWQYDGKSQILGTQTRDPSGSLVWAQTFDPVGNLVEDIEYKGGVLASKRTYTYDANRKMLESVYYNGDGSLIDGPKDPARSIYAYDSAGHLVERTQYEDDGSVAWKLKYAYDQNGNITELSLYSRGTQLTSHRTFTYEYDAAGNWTVQTLSEDFSSTCSHPMQVRNRTITYY